MGYSTTCWLRLLSGLACTILFWIHRERGTTDRRFIVVQFPIPFVLVWFELLFGTRNDNFTWKVWASPIYNSTSWHELQENRSVNLPFKDSRNKQKLKLNDDFTTLDSFVWCSSFGWLIVLTSFFLRNTCNVDSSMDDNYWD